MKQVFTLKKCIVLALSVVITQQTFAHHPYLFKDTPRTSLAAPTPTGFNNARKNRAIDTPYYVYASSENVCSGDSIFLWASCNTGNVVWYLTPTATSPLGTGAPFTTYPISNTTYYAACESQFEVSTRVATNQVVVSAKPSMPTNIKVNKTTVCRGSEAILSGSCSDGTLVWYMNQTDGDNDTLGKGSPISVIPSEVRSYYAACKSGSCISEKIATDQVIVLDVPEAPTQVLSDRVEICSGTYVSLSSSCAMGTPSWFNSAAGGSVLDGGIQAPEANAVYFGGCTNNGCESPRVATIEIVVTPQPTNPTSVKVNKTNICKGDSVMVSATCAIGTASWYTYPTGTYTFLGKGHTLWVKPDSNTFYYAACENKLCVSERVYTEEVVVNERPAIPTNVVVNNTEVCNGGSVLLSANFTTGILKWYTTASGGTAIGAGTNLSHSPTSTLIYYAACENGSCATSRIATTQLIVKPKPDKPIIGGNATICSGERIKLVADLTNPGASCYWSNGLTGLSVDVSPTTNARYRVLVKDNNCSSDSSDVFNITVNPLPQPPGITTDNPAICKGGSALLTGQTANPSDTFYWSTPASNSSNRVNTSNGANKSTRIVTEPGVYKGWSESAFGCISPENSIIIMQAANCNGQNFISIMPEKPAICPNTSITLSASGCSGAVTWTDGNSTHTGTFIKVSPSVTTSYVAQCSTGGSASSNVVVAGTNVVLANNYSTGIEHIKAVLTLQSSRKIGEPDYTPAPNVSFEAGQSIVLKPGFVAERHSTFVAEIKACH